MKNGVVRHPADQVEHVLGLGERLRLLGLDISGDRLQGIDRFGHLKVLATYICRFERIRYVGGAHALDSRKPAGRTRPGLGITVPAALLARGDKVIE
jgi:hypothetical protein